MRDNYSDRSDAPWNDGTPPLKWGVPDDDVRLKTYDFYAGVALALGLTVHPEGDFSNPSDVIAGYKSCLCFASDAEILAKMFLYYLGSVVWQE